ncbi:MAG TPA: hypothetical protein VH639_24440 [Bryobacteraceae bacterium]
MNRAIALLICLCSASFGQWLDYPTAGIPRMPDGKPNLSAPAPKLPDGKPDLSGIWEADKYYLNPLSLGLKPDEVVLTPEGEVLWQRQKRARGAGVRCLPMSLPAMSGIPGFPFKVLNSTGVIMILYESFGGFRQVFTDGRQLPEDPNPTWVGYSVGKWEGDSLVVHTTGFNDATALGLGGGHPRSESLHIVERFRRRDLGHMEIQFTIDDPKVYVKPWSFKEDMHLLTDTEILEYICDENERDLKHMVDK